MLHRRAVLVALLALTATWLSARQEAVDRPMIDRIRQEGLARSRVMEFYDRFVTVDGPRLTGSPAHKASAEWARQRFATMGLEDAQLEPLEFGRGWELTRFTIEMVAPRYMPLIGYAEGWSAPTAGAIDATPVFIGDQTADRSKPMKDSLKGAIVLTQPLQTAFVRADRDQPATSDAPVRIGAPPMPPSGRTQADTRRIGEASAAPAPASSLRPNAGEHGTMFVLGRDAGGERACRRSILAAEHYNMVARMLAAGLPVKLRVDGRRAVLSTPTATATTSIAEIPGTDPAIKDEVVLVGGTSRLVAQRARRDRQRRRRRGGARSGADPEGDRRQAAPHDPVRAVERRGGGAARLEGLRRAAPRRRRRTRPRARSSRLLQHRSGHAVPSTASTCRNRPDVAPIFDAWLEPFKDSARAGTSPSGSATPIT